MYASDISSRSRKSICLHTLRLFQTLARFYARVLSQNAEEIPDSRQVLEPLASKTQKNPQPEREFALLGLSGNQILQRRNSQRWVHTANPVHNLTRTVRI